MADMMCLILETSRHWTASSS